MEDRHVPSRWLPELLRACFEYLDAKGLTACEAVSKEWRITARDPFRWQRLYCAVWRDGASLPVELEADKLTTDDWKRIYQHRSLVPLKLSTRCVRVVLSDQTVAVISSMVRPPFLRGWVDSICTQDVLEPLAISRQTPVARDLLHADVCYFEAQFHGSGSVGFVSPPDDGTPFKYGAGRTSHVGWYPISYGYHSDGQLWSYSDQMENPYGPTWGKTPETPPGTELDTIGSGLDLRTGELFFTKNGVFLGYAPVRALVGRGYMAAVTLQNRRDCVIINLGRKAFLFDIAAFIAGGATQ